ncbi:carbamoyl phosphate synthase II, putative [Theileria annulata]|uniref:Carbamoyl phosphate synthase II, putative n=1 Tax=Theileria annulata TaxID=5874 RepID=Q4UD12_THEAN|nr:carbamoyl phosphate synthase II, putative [Theileria annulata]CAI75289.1 carbamoyl phosphate synthase II, putative [Theileria annulata]|eukprot:XP_954765.1 carbamoyl phosphate synthase II, putative [Theileria annulata]
MTNSLQHLPWSPEELYVGPPAKLLLCDGREFYGYSFGYEDPESDNPEHLNTTGELVFSTSMLGYAECVTDPNYCGQILVLTYPEIGNIGVPAEDLDEYGLLKSFESEQKHLCGLVVCNYTIKPSHWLCVSTFSDFLKKKKVPAISGVDTRALTKHLRTNGPMLGRIIIGNSKVYGSSYFNSDNTKFLNTKCFYDRNTKSLAQLLNNSDDLNKVNDSLFLYSFHSTNNHNRLVLKFRFDSSEFNSLLPDFKRPEFYSLYHRNLSFNNMNLTTDSLSKFLANTDPNSTGNLMLLVVVDLGLKNSILRSLLNNCPNNVRVLIVPHTLDFSVVDYDGLFLSNGPGNPNNYSDLVKTLERCLTKPNPIFGICLGNLVLGLAAGYDCVKMHRGNYGSNQPCIDLRTYKCYATTQSHIYQLVRPQNSKTSRWSTLFENANDNTLEGLVNLDYPFFGVQFHPLSKPIYYNPDDPTKFHDLDTSFLYKDFFTCILKKTLIPIHIRMISTHIRCKRILLLSSGGLSIGQAGEFDYSGSQAIKALKESDAKIILVNPNIATVQTSKGMAHVTYFLPITFEYVKQIIEKEKPDGIMCAFGGQTGLNVGIELYESGVLRDNNCEILGTSIKTIIDTEDRYLFNKKMTEIGERCAPSKECTSVNECVMVAKNLGYPVLIRGNFELGGFGSGFANNEAELLEIVNRLFHSNRCKTSLKDTCVHIDKSLKGWKEIEFEVLRDNNDNCVCAASMENFDPLGVHTGDSIVVAPAQTLSASECSHLRQVAFNVVRHLDLVGECNIQFAVNPYKFEYFIVELNARLSRSSALASKATGYPLAYMAAKIALGYDLVQMRNSITLCTTACFEPSLDYVVVKMPRWDLRKFENANNTIGTSTPPHLTYILGYILNHSYGSSMKSVGEVMGIGKTFEETMQKSLRMVSDSILGFCSYSVEDFSKEQVLKILANPTPERVFAIYRAFELGITVKEINEHTWIDNWFLNRLYNIYLCSERLKKLPRKEELTHSQLLYYKVLGFSDRQMSLLINNKGTVVNLVNKSELEKYETEFRDYRLKLNVMPKVNIIDTLAAEYPVVTNYCYMTYNSTEHDIRPLNDKLYSKISLDTLDRDSSRSPSSRYRDDKSSPFNKEKYERKTLDKDSIIVLGCGPYRIGSSIEFDWSAVGCIKTLRRLGFFSIIVNCNPETVSTDFDVSDRLYFEELSLEIVDEIYRFEFPQGIILSVGGQTANNLAIKLDELGLNILGTPVSSIDKCECRNKFGDICDMLGIDQPSWEEFTCVDAAKKFSNKVGFPVLARPSYVLSGASMKVISSHKELESFLQTSAIVNRSHPVVITKFIENAKEVEMDCVAKDGVIVNYAISEHVENAGTHSGDATLIIPAQNIFVDTHRRVKKITQKLSKYLNITGPFNVQFMCKNNKIKVIECNLRASRTFPLITNTLNINFIELATRVMVNAPFRVENVQLMDLDYVAVKMPLFSFDRLYPADPLLGVEMKSTGEIASFGYNKYEALLKAMTASGMKIPERGVLLSLGSTVNKFIFSRKIKGLLSLGLDVYATEGTYDYIRKLWDSERLFYNEEHELDRQFMTKLNLDDFEFDFEPTNMGEFKKVFKPTVQGNSTGTPDVYELISNRKVDLLINVSDSINTNYTTGGYMMRRAFVDAKISLITTTKLATLVIDAMLYRKSRLSKGKDFIHIKSHQEYLSENC